MPQGPIYARDISDAVTAVLNMTGNGTAIKTTGGGRVVRVAVVASSDVAGAIYDCANTASTAAGNLVFTVPATVGVYMIDWPMKTGVTVFPGGKQTLAISLA